jgi:hypothetical protein
MPPRNWSTSGDLAAAILALLARVLDRVLVGRREGQEIIALPGRVVHEGVG